MAPGGDEEGGDAAGEDEAEVDADRLEVHRHVDRDAVARRERAGGAPVAQVPGLRIPPGGINA